MVKLSDEVKLAIIKEHLDDVMMSVKMLLTIQPTFEARRQYEAGILPEYFNETIKADEFKEVWLRASEAYNEVVKNLTVFVDNITNVFDFSFVDTLPSNPDEFRKMSEDLQNDVEKYNKK